ncbi:cation:proton antiporter family protein [Enterovibrio nigricans]|uniref:Predicted Kef-type K+ transport protein, K+/H+ antiporter domain n=1 Tax=Enterovibrio nigricans DSM 22720 TaxID=1121868 RepID=A0A1T4V376_9GAMM|nr:cation:proton antiporter family protein [Enterovibrio nigricans]PKF50526.1 potassium transporter Kef [Enterovibrio nigricans]SKA59334.1 Predicted Kef-type K+ transport protein, K+/H+ antiporter domain [Enterovibrio nigricans DSM 22720]
MDLVIIAVAFLSGFLMLRCHMPPLVGFLIAGFALHAAGFTSTPIIQSLADLGVTLLLFTIGLKLDVRSLLNKEIWFGASLHNAMTTALFSLCLIGFKTVGISAFQDLAINELVLFAFALSFSSTVFAIKALQEKGEMNATYGTLAIGVLIMQDIFAVVFLTIASGKTPGVEALVLFGLPFLRPLLFRFLDKAGHGEVLVLFGIFLALVLGAGLFDAVGMKADLGALIVGMLMAGHPRASEMAKSLFNVKELFLVCFFLNIGLSEQPTMQGLMIALLLMLLLPLKGLLYYLIFNGFRFRIRTSLFATLTLFNYSEFGLIVGGIAYQLGMLPGSILVAIAIAVSLSFMISAPLNTFSHRIYSSIAQHLHDPTPENIHQNDQLIDLGKANVVILGMGRIGSGAYDEMNEAYPKGVLGIEAREDSVDKHVGEGRRVIHGDATDPDFWSRVTSSKHIELILLAMPNSQANTIAMEQIQQLGFKGKVAAIARYADELEQLQELGVDAAFNIYREAGSGFARHVKEQLL